MKPDNEFPEFPHDDEDSGLSSDDFVELVDIDAFIACLDVGDPPPKYRQAVAKALEDLKRLHETSRPGSRTEYYLRRVLADYREQQEYHRRGFIRRPK